MDSGYASKHSSVKRECDLRKGIVLCPRRDDEFIEWDINEEEVRTLTTVTLRQINISSKILLQIGQGI